MLPAIQKERVPIDQSSDIDEGIDGEKAILKDNIPNRNIDEPLCKHCGKSFLNNISLKQHLRNVHSPDREFPIVCEICSKEYNKFTIKQHVKIHTEENKLECKVCDKRFSKSILLAHMKRAHSKKEEEEERVICEICCKDYKKVSMKHHLENIHADFGNHKCVDCNKEFRSKVYLLNHKYSVHSKTTFPCETCGKTFSNKQYLARHQKSVHAAVEDVCSCETCGKQFGYIWHLKHHMKAVHDDSKMECQHCKKSYKNNYLLRKHIRKYHIESTL